MKSILLSLFFFCSVIFSIQAQTLYGTTFLGGKDERGTIIKFMPSTNNLTVTKSFEKSGDNMCYADGANPSNTLIQASNGKLYGTTTSGGNCESQYGVIFSFEPVTFTYSKLADFDYTNGWSPQGSLVQASDGKLYGMTAMGGKNNSGVLYSFDPSTYILKKLFDFDGANGSNPNGSLIQASNKKLYGMTAEGGSNNFGVIFSFDISTSAYQKLTDLNSVNGGFPLGSLLEAKGKLYGMTSHGGSEGFGVIFSYDILSSDYTKLRDFTGNEDGGLPYGNLIKATDGKLYGLTSYASTGSGVLFSFEPLSSVYTTHHTFNFYDGDFPIGSLIEAKDGKLYGLTNRGGNNNSGVIFSYNPGSSTFMKLQDFSGTNGAGPYYGSSLVEINHPIENTPPTVTITSPAEGGTYKTEKSIVLSANASDADGTIKMVQFYNGTQLIGTESDAPYYRRWYNVQPGSYTITAKATDNDGNVTVSAPVHITVVHNQPPVVSLTSPVNGANYLAPATVIISANASDADGTIKKVEFYSGTTLLHTEYYSRYLWYWKDVAAGTYTVTAKAIDDNGRSTVSSPVTITVTSPNNLMVSSGSSSINGKANTSSALTLKLSPVPARDILNIYTTGLQQNKQTTVSIISASGITIKTMQISGSNQLIPLNVSSLTSGMYIVRIVNGDKIINKQFVKL